MGTSGRLGEPDGIDNPDIRDPGIEDPEIREGVDNPEIRDRGVDNPDIRDGGVDDPNIRQSIDNPEIRVGVDNPDLMPAAPPMGGGLPLIPIAIGIGVVVENPAGTSNALTFTMT